METIIKMKMETMKMRIAPNPHLMSHRVMNIRFPAQLNLRNAPQGYLQTHTLSHATMVMVVFVIVLVFVHSYTPLLVTLSLS